MHKFILESVEKVLKDWGVDWILEERGSNFKGLMAEIELALGTVID